MARTLVTIIFMLICLVMIIVVMMQESKNSGFGALSGQVDSDVRKNRGRTKEGKLERITAILGFLFFVVAIGLCLKVFQ